LISVSTALGLGLGLGLGPCRPGLGLGLDPTSLGIVLVSFLVSTPLGLGLDFFGLATTLQNGLKVQMCNKSRKFY